jgi:nucleoside-diphosphate-sugar epimerase
MRVFVTGATGFVGSAVVADLLMAGHEVLGLARSEASAMALRATGAEALMGDLENPDSLQAGVRAADGVIHTGFVHDFTRFEECCAIEGRALQAMGAALAGTVKPIVIASGTALVAGSGLATEEMRITDTNHPHPRVISERSADRMASEGIRASLMRLAPTTHGPGDHGFVPMLIAAARKTGVSAFVGEGHNRWPTVHRLDAARLFRLALEDGTGGRRYHAVAEEGLPFHAIATAISAGTGLPLKALDPSDAAAHFGFLGGFAAWDLPTSSAWTQRTLGWTPQHPTLLQDLAGPDYFRA